MRISLASLALLAAIAGVCSGVLVGPVRLKNSKRYINYQVGPSYENTTLECPVRLEDDNEIVEVITWVLWKSGQNAGEFTWRPGEGTKATGLLEDRVNLRREGGSMEFTKLHYELNANYSCSVTLDNERKTETEQWEMLVIDTTANHVRSSSTPVVSECEYRHSFSAYAVYPKPTVRSGMYSVQLEGFYDEVREGEWSDMTYSNGSVAYEYTDRVFKIEEGFPSDAQLVSTIGVTKSDGTLITLSTSIETSYIWTTKGCPEITLKEYQIEEYWSGGHTCRGEHTPGKLQVACEKGYHADGEVKSIEFMCIRRGDGTYQWNPTLDKLGSLKCVINGSDRLSSSLISVALMVLLSPLLTSVLQ